MADRAQPLMRIWPGLGAAALVATLTLGTLLAVALQRRGSERLDAVGLGGDTVYFGAGASVGGDQRGVGGAGRPRAWRGGALSGADCW